MSIGKNFDIGNLLKGIKKKSTSFYNEKLNNEFFGLAGEWMRDKGSDNFTHQLCSWLYFCYQTTEIKEEEFHDQIKVSFMNDFMEMPEEEKPEYGEGAEEDHLNENAKMLAMFMAMANMNRHNDPSLGQQQSQQDPQSDGDGQGQDSQSGQGGQGDVDDGGNTFEDLMNDLTGGSSSGGEQQESQQEGQSTSDDIKDGMSRQGSTSEGDCLGDGELTSEQTPQDANSLDDEMLDAIKDGMSRAQSQTEQSGMGEGEMSPEDLENLKKGMQNASNGGDSCDSDGDRGNRLGDPETYQQSTGQGGDPIDVDLSQMEAMYKQLLKDASMEDEFPETFREFVMKMGDKLNDMFGADPMVLNTNFMEDEPELLYDMESEIDEFEDRDLDELEETDFDIDDVDEDFDFLEDHNVKEVVDEYSKSPKVDLEETIEATQENRNRAPDAYRLNLDYEDENLAYDFSLMVDKLVADLTSEQIQGEDHWDEVSLMERTLDKRPLRSCKYSLKKEKIVLILDTSPSCSGYSALYSKFANAALQRDDIEIFKAPNGMIERVITMKNGVWDEFDVYDHGSDVNPYMIRRKRGVNYSHYDDEYMSWNFDDRTIIFFGDTDGTTEVLNSALYNNVYWFIAADEYRGTDYLGALKKKLRGGKMYPCTSGPQFVKNAKHIRV